MSSESEGRWDFYPARINDAPASVFLDMDWISKAPVAGLPCLWWVFLKMEEPEQHGMGGDAEAKVMWAAEDVIVPLIEKRLRGHLVGRIRGEGDWQLYFYAPNAGVEVKEIEAIVSANQRLPFWVDTKADGDWSFYREFLFPSEERYQWMKDRSVVERMAEVGDDHAVPRDVDHFVYFKEERRRAAFIERAASLGFRVDHLSPHPDSPTPYGVQLVRKDATELEAIHEAVMQLVDLANEHEGDYDGWGATIVKKAD